MTVQLHNSRALRVLYLGLGTLCLGLGVVGLFLPVMPGTVFILLAGFFFARSSERFHNWLMEHPQLGPLVRDYHAGLGIPLRAKIVAVITIIASFSVTMTVFVTTMRWRLGFVAVGAALIAYIVSRPTKKPASQEAGRSFGSGDD